MNKYSNIKSNYIKEKMKNAKFEDKEFIEDLMFLEKGITQPIAGMAGNLKFFGLKSRYSQEYLELLKELAPNEVNKYEKEQQREEERIRKSKEQYRMEKEKEKRDWLKAGGKS